MVSELRVASAKLRRAQHHKRSRQPASPFYHKRGGVNLLIFQLVRNHIETRAEAERYRDRNLRSLKSDGGFPRLVGRIFQCDDGAPCEELLCARCARRYRLWQAGQILSFVNPSIVANVVTILLSAVKGRSLYKVNVRQVHERLRKRLIRCGFRAAIGGTEASYEAASDRWIVHVHLLVLGEIKNAMRRLKAVAKKDGFLRPVKPQPLRNPIAQISYLQKFTTLHRPGQANSVGRRRAYPLKPRQVAQLAKWYEGRRFSDFPFLLGFRRRGSRIVAEPGIEDLIAPCGDVATWRRDQTDAAERQFSDEKRQRAVLPESRAPNDKNRLTSHRILLEPYKSRRQIVVPESTAQQTHRRQGVATRRRRK
jgi:hypothetical protein